ncbi:MAG: SAM-dependent methyltransferase [Bacteroidota bacterium]
MRRLRKLIHLSTTGFSFGRYYEMMNLALKRLNNEFTMLHYPLFRHENDSFLRAQQNLTDYCLSFFKDLSGKHLLEIGCGNGVQALYVHRNFKPARTIGIDLNRANIDIAEQECTALGLKEEIRFMVDDAQKLAGIPSESIDVLINIESAFHYPDKGAFLNEIHRVLKPGGQFVVADILTRKKFGRLQRIWQKRMVYHYWSRHNYEAGFENAELDIVHSEDITPKIIRAYGLYKNWIPKTKRKTFLKDTAFRLFYIINVRLNVRLLKKRQSYHVFYGIKPGMEQMRKTA